MIPAAPLVGAVTTRPPAAFSSLTAIAQRLTQSMMSSGSPPAPGRRVIGQRLGEAPRPAADLEDARQDALGADAALHAVAHRLPDPEQALVDLRVGAPASLVAPDDVRDRAALAGGEREQLRGAVVRVREVVGVRDAPRGPPHRPRGPRPPRTRRRPSSTCARDHRALRVEGREAHVVHVERQRAVRETRSLRTRSASGSKATSCVPSSRRRRGARIAAEPPGSTRCPRGRAPRPARPSCTATSVPCPRPVAPSEPNSSTRTRGDALEQAVRAPGASRTAGRPASGRRCASSTGRCRS